MKRIIEGIRDSLAAALRSGREVPAERVRVRNIKSGEDRMCETRAFPLHEGPELIGAVEAYIRHVVSRGVGDLGLDPRKCPRPSVIIIVDTIKLWPEEVYETGLKVVTAGTPIPQRESLSPRVKSLNYMAHILAKMNLANQVDLVRYAIDHHLLDPARE